MHELKHKVFGWLNSHWINSGLAIFFEYQQFKQT